jgi:hypothetical protein
MVVVSPHEQVTSMARIAPSIVIGRADFSQRLPTAAPAAGRGSALAGVGPACGVALDKVPAS